MPDEWSKPWTLRLWGTWLSILGSVIALALAFFGILERDTLSPEVWDTLSTPSSWPLWRFVVAILAAAFLVSAAFIGVVQAVDRRRLNEAREKLTAQGNQMARLVEEHERQMASLKKERDDHAAEAHAKRRDLENLEGMFREQERLRMIDHITGIPNYQAWEYDLRTWAALRRSDKKFSLILLDIDRLRWLNQRNRACADEVLRFFARTTYDSMRRDEQVYKVAERAEWEGSPGRPEMYRHYQGGDEFFIFINGDVYAAIGFVNRLAERMEDWTAQVREKILTKHLSEADVAEFKLAFSASIGPVAPGTEASTALANAYNVLGRAKESTESRLQVVFDSTHEPPTARLPGLKERLSQVQELLKAVGTAPAADLRKEERDLTVMVGLLAKAAHYFPPRTPP